MHVLIKLRSTESECHVGYRDRLHASCAEAEAWRFGLYCRWPVLLRVHLKGVGWVGEVGGWVSEGRWVSE